MNWYGPNVEAYFTALFHDMVDALQFEGVPANASDPASVNG